MRPPTLTDGVVTLRAYREDDVPAVLERSVDPETQRWTTVPVPYSLDDAKTFVRHVVPGGWETDREWELAVTARDDDGNERFAGGMALMNRGDGLVELGYATNPWARRRGITERAARLLLAWGFEERGVRAVEWTAARGNWASRRLAWRLGFVVGTGRHWMHQRGALVPAWHATLAAGEPLEPQQPWYELPTLHGDGVVLRPLEEGDLPRIVETLNDAETQRWHARPREQAPHTLASQADFVRVRQEQTVTGAALHWAMADPGTDAYLGQMSLFSLLHRREASLSYWTHPDARGRRLTQQAARLAVRHCFVPWDDGGLGLRRLWSDADVRNVASRRVLERVGFVETGTDRQAEPFGDGTWADMVRLDLLASEWSPELP